LDIDPDELRIPPQQITEWKAHARISKRPLRLNGEFLKGPIPLDWLALACRLPGKSLAVGLAIWFESGRKKRRKVILTGPIFDRFGVNRFAAYRALRSLERAGLAKVERCLGKNPEVEIMEPPMQANRKKEK
jgi:hypothetical protein